MICPDEKYGGISVRSISSCYLCGSPGDPLYRDTTDWVFGTPGSWDFRKCKNSACRLIWMDPVPVMEDLGKLYSNYYTHYEGETKRLSHFRKFLRFVRDCYFADRFRYTALVGWWWRPLGRLLYLLPTRRSVIDFSIMCLPACLGGRLLEVGCGSGAFLARMHQLGWDVCGIDLDPAALARGRRITGLDLRCGTLEQIKFPADSFDVITMNHVIEHVHDPVGLLKECQRILRPNGKFVLTTPNGDSWGHRIFASHWRGLEPPRHFMIFSPQNLAECTRRSNLQTTVLRSIARWSGNIFQASKAVKKSGEQRGLGGAWVKLQAYGFQVLETLAEPFSIWSGEELYFVGYKQRIGPEN
jgi:2-polyprenyl-3-methyl-5-hydroxy-6-metoxy-1,4-benzoquinol methylase